jgi:hypothetical protein
MKKVIKLRKSAHFGVCPKCGRTSGYLNIGRDHWFICRRHRVKWYVASGIFPDWLHEDESVWKKNSELLSSFLEIEPYSNSFNSSQLTPGTASAKILTLRA